MCPLLRHLGEVQALATQAVGDLGGAVVSSDLIDYAERLSDGEAVEGGEDDVSLVVIVVVVVSGLDDEEVDDDDDDDDKDDGN